MEAGAATIRDYGLGIIPGLLQTPDYARAIIHAAVSDWSAKDVDHRMKGRMARQRRLKSDRAPRFDAVIDESVLHRVVGDQAIMRAQLKQLLELSKRPNVTLRVVPFKTGAPLSANHKFIILEFEPPNVHDVVFIESLTGDYYLDLPHQIDVYKRTFRALVEQAAEPEATYDIISAMIDGQRT
jgi:hypothetical protein